MRLLNWMAGLFKTNREINIATYRSDTTACAAVKAFAIFTTVEMVASLMSKVEYKTYLAGKELKGYEWASLNVKPNKNQNATQFWQEFYTKLLYYQEVLVVDIGGQKIIADDFNKTEYALRETMFEQVSRGTMSFTRKFRMSEVIYCKYTNANASSMIASVLGMYETLIGDAVDKYHKAGGQKGTLKISAKAAGGMDFEKTFEDLMNNRFKSYFDNKNAVMPLFDGYDYEPQTTDNVKKSTSEITDIKNLFDDAMRRAAQAYKVPPALVQGDIAGIKDAIDMLLMVCVDPLANMVGEEFTGKEFTADEIVAGSKVEADTTCIKHVDIFDIANSVDKLISSGFSSVNETREKAGMQSIDEPWADQHYITKNYQEVHENGGTSG